jgi:hypothetical protein
MPTIVLRRDVLVNDAGTSILTNDSGTQIIFSNLVEIEVGLAPLRRSDHMLIVYEQSLNPFILYDLPALLSLNYEVELNATTPLIFSVPGTDVRASFIQRDHFVEVRRYNGEEWRTQATFMVKLIEKIRETGEEGESTETYLFGCLSLEDLLAGRVVDPDDDPLEANGYSTKSGYTETVMHSYVREQLGAGASDERQIPFFAQSTDKGRGRSVGFRERHSNLLELLQRMTEPFGVDFRVLLKNSNQLVFTTDIYGRNRSKSNDSTSFFAFSENRGNLANAKLSQDYRETKNFAYILGPGEGDNRIVLNRNTNDVYATPFARREFVVDAGNTEAGSSLEALTEGDKALNDERPRVEFTFDLVQNNISQYEVNWFLGDVVTVIYGDFQQDLRIMKVAIQVQSTDEQITPTLREMLT